MELASEVTSICSLKSMTIGDVTGTLLAPCAGVICTVGLVVSGVAPVVKPTV